VTVLLAIAALWVAPPPDAPVPREPRALATRLAATTAGLGAAIDRWRTAGDPARGRPP
jgi:hypothetical protein